MTHSLPNTAEKMPSTDFDPAAKNTEREEAEQSTGPHASVESVRKPSGSKNDDRKARLSNALRDNLKRRKAQKRGRSSMAASDPAASGSADDKDGQDAS
nr:hypothetical protein [uncultured Cohaesibacter sp.]